MDEVSKELCIGAPPDAHIGYYSVEAMAYYDGSQWSGRAMDTSQCNDRSGYVHYSFLVAVSLILLVIWIWRRNFQISRRKDGFRY